MASTLMGSSALARSSAVRSPAMPGRRGGVRCSATVSGDCYKTLSLRPGATEKEVKTAFRKLALKYHPDVCKGSQCTVQFNQINQAYQMILDELKRPVQSQEEVYDGYSQDDSDEWMGCEAAFVFSGGRPESVYFY